jgi:hypothetical protein
MPTRENLERYEALLSACGMLVDIKRMVDRAEQEVRVLKLQKESGIVGTPVMGTMAPPPVPSHADGQGLVKTGSGLADSNKVRVRPALWFDHRLMYIPISDRNRGRHPSSPLQLPRRSRGAGSSAMHRYVRVACTIPQRAGMVLELCMIMDMSKLP